MPIEPYASAMSDDVARLYNTAVREVPHCYPVSREEFAAAMAAAGAGAEDARLDSEAAFVARDGGSIVGFIHAGVGHGSDGTAPERGVIRFFWYERGHRPAGQALLDAAEEHLRRRGMREVEAFQCEYRYPFYHLHWACLSDRLDQVHGMLGFNGYKVLKGELFMDWLDFEPVSPRGIDLEVDVSLDWQEGRGSRPGLLVSACQGAEQVGKCLCESGGDYARDPAAQDWAFVKSLNVVDRMQGRGLGCHLLQRALREMHAVGYRHAVISTALDNYRAMLFYANYGFHGVDWTCAMKRELA